MGGLHECMQVQAPCLAIEGWLDSVNICSFDGHASKTVETDRSMHDIIVVGAGAAGLSAACTAAALGKRVLVLEHSDRVGGTTAISGGMVWIPDNHKMKEAGLSDTAEAAREYLQRTVPGSAHDPPHGRVPRAWRRSDPLPRGAHVTAAAARAPLPGLLPRVARRHRRRPGARAGSVRWPRARRRFRAPARSAARVPAVRRHDDQSGGSADPAPRGRSPRAAVARG